MITCAKGECRVFVNVSRPGEGPYLNQLMTLRGPVWNGFPLLTSQADEEELDQNVQKGNLPRRNPHGAAPEIEQDALMVVERTMVALAGMMIAMASQIGTSATGQRRRQKIKIKTGRTAVSSMY